MNEQQKIGALEAMLFAHADPVEAARLADALLGLRLWDYRGLLWNVEGLVCLRSVLSFGALGLLFHYLLEPMGRRLYRRFQPRASQALAVHLAGLFCLDCLLSLLFRTPITY